MERIKKDFETLTDEAIENVREDRTQTKELLKDLIKYLSNDDHRHKEVGLTAAKYVETLQRSNEQLVKIISLKQKDQEQGFELSDDDKSSLFDMIQGNTADG